MNPSFQRKIRIRRVKSAFDPFFRIKWTKSKPREYFDWLAKKLNIETQEGWYFYRKRELASVGGKGFWRSHHGSLCSILSKVYPEYTWDAWRFFTAPIGQRHSVESHRNWFDLFAQQHGVVQQEDWYKVRLRDISSKDTLLWSITAEHYRGSLIRALEKVYSEFQWQPWRFNKTLMGYWDKVENQREYLDWVGEQLNLKSLDDWYKVQRKTFFKLGGQHFLIQHGHSLIKALLSVYPEHDWKVWKFGVVNHRFWCDMDNQRAYFEWLKKELNLKTAKDWYSIKPSQLNQMGIAKVLRNYNNSLRKALQAVYPDELWSSFQELSEGHKFAFHAMRSLLGVNVFINYKHPNLFHKDTFKPMEFDIYVPSLKIALEYQGEQHYFQVKGHNTAKQCLRDENKLIACRQHGITLIQIPYWWDCTPSRLAKTLAMHRPDLVPSMRLPKRPFDTEQSARQRSFH